MKFAFNRYEYKIFKDESNFSIRKIYFNDNDLKAYSSPVVLQADNLEDLKNLLNDCAQTLKEEILTKNDFKNN